jgi:hypothetical protein
MKEMQFSNETLLELERSLKSKLNPVKPDLRFINTLRDKLLEQPDIRPHHRTALTMLTIAGGLFLGLAIYLIGRGYFGDQSLSG